MANTKKPRISVISSYSDGHWEKFESAAKKRHVQLFKDYGIGPPPLPDDATDPRWRDLALALARKHEPAFKGNAGRPPVNQDENITWMLASHYFERLNNCSTTKADEETARHFGVNVETVKSRLKDMRKKTGWQKLFPALLDQREAEIGREKFLAALAPGSVAPEMLHEIDKRRKWLDNYPYGDS